MQRGNSAVRPIWTASSSSSPPPPPACGSQNRTTRRHPRSWPFPQHIIAPHQHVPTPLACLHILALAWPSRCQQCILAPDWTPRPARHQSVPDAHAQAHAYHPMPAALWGNCCRVLMLTWPRTRARASSRLSGARMSALTSSTLRRRASCMTTQNRRLSTHATLTRFRPCAAAQ